MAVKSSRPKLDAEAVRGLVLGLLRKGFDDATEIPECHMDWWKMCCGPHAGVALAAPRGHGKSTAITLSYTLACILFRERKFVLLISDTETQSAYFLGNIKKQISDNEDLKKFFGNPTLIKDTENDAIIEFDDGYQCRIVAKGSEQKLRGLNWNGTRPDLIICDDIENDEIVLNKERREKFRRWFSGALLPCRSKGGIIRVIGTILHMDSLLERYMPRSYSKDTVITALCERTPETIPNWMAARYRAHPSTNDFSEVLWSTYKSAAWLKAEQRGYREQGLGDVYAQEYLNQPIDDSNSLFRKSDFGTMRQDDRSKNFNYYISMDLAVTQKSTSDYSVFMVAGVDENGHIHIVNNIKDRLDSLQIVDMIMALNKHYKPDFFVVEKGTITQTILPMIKVKMYEENNWFVLNTITAAVDKVSRTQSMRARMRAGMVKFDKESEWYTDLEQECIRFPRDRHDDQVDSLSLLGLALDKFVEAATKKEIEQEEYEEEIIMSGLGFEGRSQLTGY
jgi:predicted phage terminase large subunit-like protein